MRGAVIFRGRLAHRLGKYGSSPGHGCQYTGTVRPEPAVGDDAEDVQNCVQTLDILSLLNDQKQFKAMAMALCNEAKRRFNCERVSLGCLEEPYVRLQAISNLDRFEKKMDVVGLMEAMMEECVDQDEDLLFPAPSDLGAVLRDHEAYAKAEGVNHILSVPLRMGERAVGALTFERETVPFREVDLRATRVLADQVVRWVVDMKKEDRWGGARMLESLRKGLGASWATATPGAR